MPFGPNSLIDFDCDLSELRKIDGRPGYYINKQGQVFTIRLLRQFTDEDGYKRISTGKVKKAIHWLLAKVFLPTPKPNQIEVRHLDGNPANNSIDNLAWGTRAENAADMARHGTVKGSKNSRAILNEQQVVEIVNLSRNNTTKKISKLFGVSKSVVKAILSGRNWSHVTGIKRKTRGEHAKREQARRELELI